MKPVRFIGKMKGIRTFYGALIILLTVSCNHNYSKFIFPHDVHRGDEWTLTSRLGQALYLEER
jgi:hypothetical protein